MRHPLTLVLRALRCAGLIIGMRVTVSAQTFPSTTSIAANTPSLVLPGTLTLTSIINQPTLPGGVATGNVSFTSDGNLLGTAPLTRLPATQSFPNAPTTSFTSGSNPAALVAVDLLGTGKPALVVGNNFSGGASVSVYPNMGAGKFGVPGTLTGQLPTGQGQAIDAMAIGNFLSTTSKSTLIHQQGNFDHGFYNVVSVNASGAELAFVSSQAGFFSQADTEVIAIDDFDSDGYSDVGVILLGENGTSPRVGIALNQGASGVPGEFDILMLATLPSPPPNSGSVGFCADAITTGKFNSASNAQLAVLGHFYSSCTVTPPALTPSYLAIYAYTPGADAFKATSKTSLTHSQRAVPSQGILRPLLLTGGTTTIQVGTDQTTIAAADFNGDGKLDLVVGSALNSQVQIYDGNGDGTFSAAGVTTASTLGPPSAITINDFNGDGFPDLAVTLSSGGGPAILRNDRTGKLEAATQPLASVQPVGIATADFNGDGLADLAFLEPGTTTDVLLSAEAAQATLPVTTPMLAAGSHMLVASYPGDTNFQPSTSSVLTENVSKTIPTITWFTPPDVTYPTTLTNSQLNATSDIAGGRFTYTFPASAGCNPSSVTEPAGSTAFSTNCTPLPGKQLITVLYNPPETFDYESNAAQATLTVDLPIPKATVNVPSTAAPGDTPSIAFTLDSYPVAVTVTITLGFTDNSSNPASSNGSICFLNIPANDTTYPSTCPTSDTFTITANTGGAITPRTFSAGDVAGTVLVTIKLIVGTTDITPATLVPQSLAIAPTVPQIQTVTMNPQGTDGLQVVIVGSSSTREISSATFHFTAASGKTLKNPDITISNIPEFAQWFSSTDSAQYGSAFTYTQNFTLDENADTVGGVSVVLQNTVGPSASQPAQ